jgi:hypothetical protein
VQAVPELLLRVGRVIVDEGRWSERSVHLSPPSLASLLARPRDEGLMRPGAS